MEDEEEENKAQTIESTKYEGWEDNYNTLLLRLDPSPTLEKIRRMLLNQRFDKTKEEWVSVKNLKPRMKEEGTEKLMLELYSRMSIDKVLSNLKETEINMFCRQVGEVILQFLWFNSEEFDIAEDEFESILWIVIHNIKIFLKRALLGFENKGVYKSMAYKEISQRRDIDANVQMQQQQKVKMNPFSR